jgi:hypothetical protein
MDMSNATASGPSYGLLDVIFGGNTEEGAETDGQGLMPMMELIKALNGKNQDEETGDRTDKEIAPGKDAVDYGLVGMPGMLPNLLMAQAAKAEANAQGEGAQAGELAAKKLQALPGGKLLAAMENAAPGAVDPALVNRMLQEKSLPPLSPEEAKLLSQVNGKLAKVSGIESPEAAAPDTKAAPADPREAALAKELAKKGIDSSQVKGESAQTAGAAPNKMLSTEAYLQMHERFTGAKQAKNELETTKRLGGEEAASAGPAKDALLAKQVNAADQKGNDLFGKAGHKLPELAKDEKGAPKLSTVPFEAGLLQATKADLDTRDVVLDSTKPAAIREALLGEVNQGIGFHAVKGGGEMRLVIHPEALGEVKLKISTRGDGKVEVQVSAQNDDVARIIRGGSKDLESSLRDQNLTLAKFDVNVTADAPVASIDTRSSLSDQFMPNQQNAQQGFSQAGSEQGQRFSQWDGNQQQSGRQHSSAEMTAGDNNSRSAMSSAQKNPARGSSRRLDVVA